MTIGRDIHLKVKISLSLSIITSREYYIKLSWLSQAKNFLIVYFTPRRGGIFPDFDTIYYAQPFRIGVLE